MSYLLGYFCADKKLILIKPRLKSFQPTPSQGQTSSANQVGKLTDFLNWIRNRKRDGGRERERMRGGRVQGAEKPPGRDEQMDREREREPEMEREKKELLSPLPVPWHISGSKARNTIFEFFIWHLGPLKTKVPAANEGFFPRVFKAVAWPNLEDNIVYSWWKDKPASRAPPPHGSRVGITGEQRHSAVQQQAFGFD